MYPMLILKSNKQKLVIPGPSVHHPAFLVAFWHLSGCLCMLLASDEKLLYFLQIVWRTSPVTQTVMQNTPCIDEQGECQGWCMEKEPVSSSLVLIAGGWVVMGWPP